ncbi:MAG: indolepyruvate oxidoreductase subunit beta family protein [Rhodocyclaceae bacterium]
MNAQAPRPICILVAALGGEGGGVLADYLVEAATAEGFPVQSTSIPGVAQRTGATTYYVEIYPVRADALGGHEPVLSLIPGPGNVDVLIASELVETGRALRNGFVSPERTTVVASTHRIYATAEKIRPGDGRYRGEAVIEAAGRLARRALLLDMARLAGENGSVINTVLFGAAAGSGALGLTREACEGAIRRAGKSVEASLRGFAAGFAAAAAAPPQAPPPALAKPGAERLPPALAARCATEFPAEMQELLRLAAARLIDYQDERYAGMYLDRLRDLARAEGEGGEITRRAARGLAVWMAYEDIQRVAALKSRASRLDRVRREARAKPDEPVRIVDYFRPGPEELADILPPGLYTRIIEWWKRPRPAVSQGGWCIAASSVSGQLALRVAASLKRVRRASARYAAENALIERWLAALRRLAGFDPAAALELAECARLVKGYAGTRDAARARFERVLAIAEAPSPGAQAAPSIRAMRETWLAQVEGEPPDSPGGRSEASTKPQTVVFIPKSKPAASGKTASG